MPLLNQETFICLDCETTGLDAKNDKVIEVAVVKFTFDHVIEQFESLLDPECVIPESSIEIHHITQEMVAGKPKIVSVVPRLLEIIGNHIIVGHGIEFDIALIANAAERHGIPHGLKRNRFIDTSKNGTSLWRQPYELFGTAAAAF